MQHSCFPSLSYSQRRSVAAWMGLLLLLLNVLSTALVAPRPALAALDAQRSQAQSFESQQIVICTPTGLRVITVGPDGTPREQNDKAREGSCPLCLPLNNPAVGALPLAEAALWALPRQDQAQKTAPITPPQGVALLPQRPERAPGRPRDPPYSFL